MPTVLITGANRGLGLEFARQYASDGWHVHATCRRPDQAGGLHDVAASGRLELHGLDVADFDAIDALAKKLTGPIDVLINNAGLFPCRGSFGNVDYDAWTETLRVNAMAPQRIAEQFIEHLVQGEHKVIANVTSKMGSIDDNTSGGCYVYRSSKSALNMVTKSQAHDLRHRGVTAIVLHPGWVATDMGGAGAPLEAPQSVEGMRKVIAGVSIDDSGKFFNWDGSIIPW